MATPLNKLNPLTGKYEAIGGWAYVEAPVGTTVPSNGIISSPNTGDLWLEPWYARKAPTVATPGQPVISKTFTNDLAYDNTNPSDYLMRLNARMQATGKKPTETERYNMYQAQDALQKQSIVSPFDTTALQGQIDTARTTENTSDAAALDAYKKQLDAQYTTDSARLQSQSERQKQAEQNIYSFGGGGRWSAAARSQGIIEQNKAAAINQLDLARQTAIALKDAELRGADSAELQALNKQMETYQKWANDRQVESIKSTAAANQKTGASYIESINNLMTAAEASGLDINKAGFENAALALKGMEPKQQKEYLATLDPQEALLLQGLSNAGTWEAAKTITRKVGKNEYIFQWNPKTNLYDIPVWGSGWSGGGNWWAGSRIKWTVELAAVSAIDRIKTAMANNPNLPLSSVLYLPDVSRDLNFLKSNLTLNKFLDVKKAGWTFGAMSEWEWKILADSVGNIWGLNSKDTVDRFLNDIVSKAGWTSKPYTSYAGGQQTTTTPVYDAKKTYKAGDTFTKDGKTYKFDGTNAIQQ